MKMSHARSASMVVVLALASSFAVSCSQTKEATKEVASSATSAASSAASAAGSAVSTAASAASSAVTSPAGKTTLYYPEQDGALFSIEAPDDWKVEKIDQVGDFGTVESPNGSVVSFRAQNFDTEAAAEKETSDIADSTFEFLKDNYTDVKLDEPQKVTVGGQPGAEISGNGKDKAGNAVKFMSAIIALGPKSVAEIWAAVFPEGNNDLDTANAVLDSFKPLKTQ